MNLHVQPNDNSSFNHLTTDIADRVRFDTGNFQNNDWTFAGQSLINFVLVEPENDTDDDGSGNTDDGGQDGFTRP